MINNEKYPDFGKHVYKQMSDLLRQHADDDKLLTNMLLLVSTGAFGASITFLLNKNQLLNKAYALFIY